MRIREGAPQEEVDDAVRIAKKILTLEPKNALARHIVWFLGDDEGYKDSWAPVSPRAPLFTSYPLIEQDTDLAEHIQTLSFCPLR